MSLETAGLIVLLVSIAFVLYTYVGYPLLLRLLARDDQRPLSERGWPEGEVWPLVSVTVPAYNEEKQIAEALEHILALDYPKDRLEIVVVSDASSDRTDEIVRGFADRGVKLHRRPERAGKTAAENALAPLLSGDIVLNTDASIRISPDALKKLVAPLRDPGVGLATGRDVSVSRDRAQSTEGESTYVGYEMGVRALETRAGGIVGASGCLYAIRAELHRHQLPENLSRDFASALVSRSAGYRAVSVESATCMVPRTHSLQKEYRRKVRTMVRGMRTLAYKRYLLNPFTQGAFAWRLLSHKVCRWASSWALLAGVVGLLLMATGGSMVGVLGAAVAVGVALAALLAWFWPDSSSLPRLIALPAFAAWSNVAAIHASLKAPLGSNSATWEPTRRQQVGTQSSDSGGSAQRVEVRNDDP